jgi:putative restriction endonuclease
MALCAGDSAALEAAGQGEPPDEGNTEIALQEREVVLRTIVTAMRDSQFRRRVVAAHDGRCAICGVQLGLPDAAHIIPVGSGPGSDATSNALALCPSHHRAYDAGLIGVNGDYSIVVNDAVAPISSLAASAKCSMRCCTMSRRRAR